MLKNKELKKILEVCLETGGDFAELYFEDTIKNNYELTSGKVTRINTSNLYGVSIRILKGAEESFGYTSDISFESLMNLAKKLNASLNYPKEEINFELKEIKAPVVNLPVILPSSLSNNEKIKYLELLNKGIFTYESEEINQVICVLSDEEQKITVVNTLGKIVKDLRTHIRLAANVIAKSENIMQTAFDSIAGNQGYEIFNGFNYNEFGYEIAKTAINMLHADEMIGGNMDVVLHNGFGGVLLHEACVHSLEATSVAKGNSVFCNKLGQKIASDIVTAVDDGTIPNGWGSLNIDDEGNETKRNVLIKDGVLQTYLVDYRNSKIMNHPITGSGRRQSYKYSPTSRMTNTFFTPGTSSFEEIIASTKFGLFAKRMGGGSVNPTTGEFNFSVNEGYMIENGEITKPVRGATLVGSGAHILKNIDMIANNLEFSFGMCGSQSGSIPTIVGQPTVRVLNLTVGGRGEKIMDYQKLFDYGKKMGFDDLEIGIGHNQSLSISLFEGKVEKNVAIDEKKFLLKGLLNDKMAQISFEDENIDEIELIKKLKENVESLTTDEKYEIFAGSEAYPDSINRSGGFKNITSLEKIELLKSLEKEILSLDERIKAVPHCSYEEDSSVVQIINSKGLNLEKTGEYCFLVAQAVAKQGEETQDAFEVKAVLNYKDFNVKEIAKKLVDQAIAMLGAKPIKSGQYPIIFEKKAMSSLFGAFSSLFNGEAAIKKLTSLIGKEGQEIMNKNINIIEDPLDINYISYQPFDDEGVATYKKYIVKEGIFTSFIHNLKTAKYFNTQTTGNGYNSSVGFSNVYIEAGSNSFDDIISGTEEGLLITSMSGLHAGVNAISGDFSLQSSGFYIKKGKIEKPVTLIVVSGNFLKMMNNIQEIGSDLELRYNGISAPSIKVKSLPVSGE